MKKSPKLKPVERREQWHKGLEAFRVRHGLSIRDLAGVCSMAGQFVSKSAVDRLCKGSCEPRFVEKVRPAILQSLRTYLQGMKLKPAEIDAELRSVFCKQEVEIMITQRAELTVEAQTFFGLSRDPFTGDPRKLDEVFTTPALDKIQRLAEETIRYQGFRAFIGDIGTGKTTLKKCVNEMVDRSRGKLNLLWPEFFNMDKVHSGSIVYFLLHHFGQKCPQDLLSRAAALKTVLEKLADDGKSVALGFDECHRLDKRLIVALKNFWELSNGGFVRYLGVILFGQNSFEFILREHREIHERCQVVRMPEWDKSSFKYRTEYLTHRLQIAGGKLDRLFEPAAIARMVKLSSTPQGLGNIANAGLMEAFEHCKAGRSNQKRVLEAFIPEKNGDPQVRAIRPAQN